MCCCFSSKFVKFMVYVGCAIVIGIGSVLIWGGYEYNGSPFNSLIGYTYIGYIIIAFGGSLVLFAFMGFLGTWKESKFLLFFFIFISIILGILLIAFGAGAIYARALANQYLGSQSDCIKKFSSADQSVTKAEGNLCTINCPCLATSPYAQSKCVNPIYCTLGAKSILECNPCLSINITGTTAIQVNEILIWVKSNLNLDVTAQSCSISTTQFKDNYFSSTKQYLSLLTWIENSFDCSGLCTQQQFYLFSDINRGQPKNGRLPQLHDWVENNFLIYGIVGIIVGVFIVLFI